MTVNQIIAISDDVLGDCSDAVSSVCRGALLEDQQELPGWNSGERRVFGPLGLQNHWMWWNQPGMGNLHGYGRCRQHVFYCGLLSTIEDTTALTISAQDFTLSLDGNGEATSPRRMRGFRNT